MNNELKAGTFIGFVIVAALVMIFTAMPVQAGGYSPALNAGARVMDISEVTGTVEVVLRAGGSAQDTTVYITDKGSRLPFDKNYTYERDAPETNEGWMRLKVLPMGITEPIRLIPGLFIVALKNGNGGQMEMVEFPLLQGENKRVTLLGHAVGSHSDPEYPKPTPTLPPTPVCDQVIVTFKETPNGVWYHYDNSDNITKTVYVYVTEDYFACAGVDPNRSPMDGIVNCPRPTPTATPTPTPTPTPRPTFCTGTTRSLNDVASSSRGVGYGITEVFHVIPRMPNHIRYTFDTETHCF